MYRLLFITFLLFYSTAVFAGSGDSLFIGTKNDKWFILHKAKAGETVLDIATLYHVPPAMIADENGLNYQSPVGNRVQVYVPFGSFNKVGTVNANKACNIYYRVLAGDNLYRISRYAGESQRTLQDWNMLPDNNVEEGQVIIVAKILYDGGEKLTAPKNDTAKKTLSKEEAPKYTLKTRERKVTEADGSVSIYIEKDTVWADTIGLYGQMYMKQTMDGKNIKEEKGTAVFYTVLNKPAAKPKKGIVKTLFIYAFHNGAKRGDIIRVFNPGTDKFVFVKVMGPLPETKQYHNSIIGISDDAKELLGVVDEKAWVELSYAP